MIKKNALELFLKSFQKEKVCEMSTYCSFSNFSITFDIKEDVVKVCRINLSVAAPNFAPKFEEWNQKGKLQFMDYALVVDFALTNKKAGKYIFKLNDNEFQKCIKVFTPYYKKMLQEEQENANLKITHNLRTAGEMLDLSFVGLERKLLSELIK